MNPASFQFSLTYTVSLPQLARSVHRFGNDVPRGVTSKAGGIVGCLNVLQPRLNSPELGTLLDLPLPVKTTVKKRRGAAYPREPSTLGKGVTNCARDISLSYIGVADCPQDPSTLS